MSLQPTNVIQVQYCPGKEALPMGRLVLKDRKIFFEYAPAFLELGIELSPFKLPLRPGIIASEDPIFGGLFGVFNDSLPDGWGRLLLDRDLLKQGISPGNLTPLDRLRYVGRRGMGALFYEPEMEMGHTPPHPDLDRIAEECWQVQTLDNDQFVEDLLAMNGSSAGARPKILVSVRESTLETTSNAPSAHHNDWMVKFRSTLDPEDIGPMEYAYHLMAVAAGVDVPEAKLFSSKKGPGYFGVKRFDRSASKFFHMHTVSGLLHVDHRIPSFAYETLMKATLWLTKDEQECEKQFRHAAFNVLAHNRDDHVKNFSFLMDETGKWSVSPAYDLTFSAGPAGEHCTTILGEGKNPNRDHLLKLATAFIKPSKALEILKEVSTATADWKRFADEAGVTHKSRDTVQTALTKVSKHF